jgi:hypothetical protein
MSLQKVTAKPELSREQLEGHSIKYADGVFALDKLETWLRPICSTITRLQAHIPEVTRKAFNKELDQFSLHGQDSDDAHNQGWCLRPVENLDYLHQESYTTSETKRDHLKPESCKQALKAVRECRTSNENEERWQQVLCEHVFWDFHKANSASSSYE